MLILQQLGVPSWKFAKLRGILIQRTFQAPVGLISIKHILKVHLLRGH
jgi:hypothetical protein